MKKAERQRGREAGKKRSREAKKLGLLISSASRPSLVAVPKRMVAVR